MGNTVGRLYKPKHERPLPLLAEDIIKGEILTRLPVKSLVRFRCVCKSWKYLLSCDPVFAKSHLTHACMDPNNSALIVKLLPAFTKDKFHLLNSKYLNVAGSINGLVCVYHYIPDDSILCIGIWNPATCLYKDIPPPSRAFNIRRSTCHATLGFGFDPITNDYKVIFITMSPDSSPLPFVADVYSCNAESWGSSSVTSTFLSRGAYCMWPTIVHGRPYWYNYDVDCPEHYNVMSFDIQRDVFRLLPGIESVGPLRTRVMVNLRDTLVMMIDCQRDSATQRSVEVYFFHEECGCWSKNYTIGPIPIPRDMILLNCFSNGDLIFFSGFGEGLLCVSHVSYGINRFGNGIYVYETPPHRYVCLDSYGYIESLVSVKGMNPMQISKVESDILVIDRNF